MIKNVYLQDPDYHRVGPDGDPRPLLQNVQGVDQPEGELPRFLHQLLLLIHEEGVLLHQSDVGWGDRRNCVEVLLPQPRIAVF